MIIRSSLCTSSAINHPYNIVVIFRSSNIVKTNVICNFVAQSFYDKVGGNIVKWLKMLQSYLKTITPSTWYKQHIDFIVLFKWVKCTNVCIICLYLSACTTVLLSWGRQCWDTSWQCDCRVNCAGKLSAMIHGEKFPPGSLSYGRLSLRRLQWNRELF